ncbi:bacterial translation initiation factor 3 [Sesbania bispinosa]|nr:bacterial translation initiation factor 3 [Sesbania bispinosa]
MGKIKVFTPSTAPHLVGKLGNKGMQVIGEGGEVLGPLGSREKRASAKSSGDTG